MRLCTLLSLVGLVAPSLALMLEQETCDAGRMMVDHNVAAADVVLGGIFDIRGLGSDGYGCGEPLDEEIMMFEAARWTINKINADNFVNGVRFGMRSYDTCHQPFRAAAAANNFYSQYSTSTMYCNTTNKLNLGIVGALKSFTTKPVAELTSKFPASVISPMAASPELSDKSQYPYFMRTGISASEQIKAMMKGMALMNWERVVVVYSDDSYGLDSAQEFIRLSQENDVCVVETIAVPTNPNLATYMERIKDIGNYDVIGVVFFGANDASMEILEAAQSTAGGQRLQWMFSYLDLNRQFLTNRLRGAISVQPVYTEVSEFYNYFTTQLNENNPIPENPWYRDWFMSTFQCQLRDVNYAPYSSYSDCDPKTQSQKKAAINMRNPFVDPTITAVYAFASALKTAHQEMCGTAPGVCLGLQQMSAEVFHNRYLKNVNLNVGSFVDNILNLEPSNVYMYDDSRLSILPQLPTSPCPSSGCKNCLVPRNMVDFNFRSGDIVLAGLFDIHAVGSEVFTCGSLKPSHAINAAAFKFALENVKSLFPGILPGVQLGSLIVDLCDNAEKGRLLMNDLLGGRRVVADKTGKVVDPNLVSSVVGELDSGEAMSMATMLGHFGMPYMESSATSVQLSNKEMFPTFSRAVPSDYHQMLAIVLMLKRMGWNYVQVVYQASEYGRTGYKILKEEGATRGICVAEAQELDGNHNVIVNNFNQKPAARIVVGIVDSYDYREMLRAMQDQNLKGKFILIGSETWGRRSSVIAGYESIADGSVTLDIDAPALNNYRTWLNSKRPNDPTVMKDMPFFTEWYQYAFSCYLDAESRGVYTTECNPNQQITNAPRYEETTYTSFFISATYAVARALDTTLRDVCGTNYNGLCWQFRSNADVKQKIQMNLADSQFDFNGYPFRMKDSEGLANYNLYSFTAGRYIRIGTYNTANKELDMTMSTPVSLPDNFFSQCMGFCSECVYLVQTRPYIIIPGDDLKIGVNFAIHSPGSDPFLCGAMRLTNGMQSFLAVSYALDQVKSSLAPVSLNDVDVGAIMMDHCNSPARAYGLPSALYSGILGSMGADINLNTIRAWLTDNALVTEGMKDFFSDLNLPVISPMATTNKFLNEEEYPTFIRTVQGDSTVASALAMLVKSLGLQYVSIVYSANSFGRAGTDAFAEIAMQEGICVIKHIEMNGLQSDDMILEELTGLSTHVVITYLSLEDMDKFLSARGRNVNATNLLIISPEPYPMVLSKQGPAARNVLSLKMRSNTLTSFQDFVRSFSIEQLADHPTLRQYYMALFQCNLPGEYSYQRDCTPSLDNIVDSPDFHEDNYILPIINAVYTYIAATDETLKIQCGENYSGVCAKFYTDPNTNTILYSKLTDVSFQDDSGSTFQYIGKEGNTGREITLFDGSTMTKVADFAGASINILSRNLVQLFDNTRSGCNPPCTQCINNNMNFTYIPGDILLGGIFDVHEADLRAFSCGDINTLRGFQLLEAFHYAINKVNDKSGQFANILKNIKLGGIGLDACQSAVRGGYLVSNIYSGLTELFRDDEFIDPDKIDAYIGTYSSDRSIHLARLLKSLNMPQISFGSTSVTLTDENRYPFFLRTVPADDRQVTGMIKFLREFDIRYVQVVHSADNYGEQGAEIFKQVAADNRICIAQTISFPYKKATTIENANDIVLSLLQKPVANTVVIFADSSQINSLLQAIKRSPEAYGKFKFVGSDTWANNVESTDGQEDIAVGSVTFDLDINDLAEFDQYLATKTPANYPDNPWFPEYYEAIHNCYLTIPDKRYPTRCSATPRNIVSSQRYKQDTGIIHVINAVFAAAYGLDSALREECGENYTTVCEVFKNRDKRRMYVLDKIREVEFEDLSGSPFSFYPRGDAKKGYVIYSLDTSPQTGYAYNRIGSYSSEGELVVSDYQPSWDGSCNRADSCTECPVYRNLFTRYMLPVYPVMSTNPNPATLVMTLAIHNYGSDPYHCGPMDMTQMINALAVVYMLEGRVNMRPLILDNCGNQIRIDQDLINLLSRGELCNENFDWRGSKIDASTIMGVMTMGSTMVVGANRVTAPLQIQLLGIDSSSTQLSNRESFPYFARMVPPDNLQMEVIAKILKQNDWTYVGVIYEAGSYGVNAYRALQAIVNSGKYSCIGVAAVVNNHDSVEEVRPAVRRIAEEEGVNVVVILTLKPSTVLQAIAAEGLYERFLVIGSDTWANYDTVVDPLETDDNMNFRGAITVGFRDAFFEPFVSWLSGINSDNKKGMPDVWFDEFYQHIHECRLPGAIIQTNYEENCLSANINRIPDGKLRSYGVGIKTLAATKLLSDGLTAFLREYSCNDIEFSECLATRPNARVKVFESTLEQDWTISRTDVQPKGEFIPELGDDRYYDSGYSIYALFVNETLPANERTYYYERIGDQTRTGFRFNATQYAYQGRPGVVSKCPEGKTCNCVVDDKPTTEEQVQPKYMRDHEPRNYFMYDADTGKQVLTWPIWAVAVSVLTCIGLLVGIILFFFFMIFYPVRGGTTALGFLMMLGIFGIYAINFAFFLPASEATCGAREFLMGVVYAFAICPLLVKAIDNWRFKDTEYSSDRYVGLTNPCALVLIALGIILVQCIIPIEWLILQPPSASMMTDTTAQNDWMWCDPHDFYDISLVLSMVFVIFLILLTAIFSALSWDSDSNYFESRWIFVSCVCTAGCFLVWMVVSTNAGPPYRDPAVAIANFVNATALLLCNPFRKLILLIRFSSEEEKAKSLPADDASGPVRSDSARITSATEVLLLGSRVLMLLKGLSVESKTSWIGSFNAVEWIQC
ncbi:GRM7-like protein [Mya arenaria]|uniref:GRM7-like protein n=1 Tax=Mya arenaria TaxID=6604 RepID=A0ABY7E3K5_MYAAR|nr:GRM7-like protein [Mya arenaria]